MLDKSVQVAAALCRRFEGLRLEPYICPAGYPTIGYGTVFKPDGTKVTMNDSSITRETAEDWLMHEIKYNYLPGILKASPLLISYPIILGALVDFGYNLGVPRYRSSTLRKRVEDKNWDEVCNELQKWVYGGGRKLPGLIKRRQAEIDIIRTVSDL